MLARDRLGGADRRAARWPSGQAILRALRAPRVDAGSPGPVGLAALLVVCGIAVRLRRARARRSRSPARALVIAAAWRRIGVRGDARAAAARRSPRRRAGARGARRAAIPFIAAGRVGILGVGLVNDDMASHLLLADWLGEHFRPEPVLIDQGYPLGPHALVAGLATLLGAGLDRRLRRAHARDPGADRAGRLRGARRPAAAAARRSPRRWSRCRTSAPPTSPRRRSRSRSRRCSCSPSRCCCPRREDWRAAIPLGVLAAGAIYVYSFPGLAWLAGGDGVWVLVELDRRRSGEVRGTPQHGREDGASTMRSVPERHRSTAPLGAAVGVARPGRARCLRTRPPHRLHRLPRPASRPGQRGRARQPAPASSRRSRRSGSGRRASSGSRRRPSSLPAAALLRRRRCSPSSPWRWRSRAGSAATAPRSRPRSPPRPCSTCSPSPSAPSTRPRRRSRSPPRWSTLISLGGLLGIDARPLRSRSALGVRASRRPPRSFLILRQAPVGADRPRRRARADPAAGRGREACSSSAATTSSSTSCAGSKPYIARAQLLRPLLRRAELRPRRRLPEVRLRLGDRRRRSRASRT